MRAGAHVPSGLPPRGPIKPIGATTAGGTRTSNLETNDLSRFHKAQVELAVVHPYGCVLRCLTGMMVTVLFRLLTG